MRKDTVMLEQISFNQKIEDFVNPTYYFERSNNEILIAKNNPEFGFDLAVCFFYIKGKRPDLPYDVNKKGV